MRVFIAAAVLKDNRRLGQDKPAVIVRHDDGTDEFVHEVVGDGWAVRTTNAGPSPLAWVEVTAPCTLVRREAA